MRATQQGVNPKQEVLIRLSFVTLEVSQLRPDQLDVDQLRVYQSRHV